MGNGILAQIDTLRFLGLLGDKGTFATCGVLVLGDALAIIGHLYLVGGYQAPCGLCPSLATS